MKASPWPWAVGIALLVGLLLGWRMRRPDPAATQRIAAALAQSAALSQRADSLGAEVLRLTAFQSDTTQTRREADSLHRRRIITPDTGTIAPAPGARVVLFATYQAAAAEADAYRERLVARETTDSIRADSAAHAFAVYDSTTKANIAGLRTALVEAGKAVRPMPKWTASALWNGKSPTPIGAELMRGVGPLAISLQVRWDSLQALAGVGLRF